MGTLEDRGYHVLGRIANGGMAEVVLAERVGPAGIKKQFAIKRILPALRADVEFVRMLENEARIAITLDHPNVVGVFEFGEADGELFLAMEYVRGFSLAAILNACNRKRVAFPIALAIDVGHALASALAYAHEHEDEDGVPLGIVHRDVTPGNVLVSTGGHVKLADFGIARACAFAKTTPGTYVRGKVPYMSPEQAKGNDLDARSDLYSLGIVIYEMITVRRLFPATMFAAHEARKLGVARVSTVRPEAAVLDELLAKALALDPNARFGSAREMARALARVLATVRASHRPDGPEPDMKGFLRTLELPEAVTAENVGDGETTRPMSTARWTAATDTAETHVPDSETASETVPSFGPPPTPMVGEPPPTPRSRKWLVALGIGTFILALVGTRVVAASRLDGPDTRLEVRTKAPGVPVVVDGVPRGVTPMVVAGLPRTRVQVLVGSADGGRSYTIDLADSPDSILDVAAP